MASKKRLFYIASFLLISAIFIEPAFAKKKKKQQDVILPQTDNAQDATEEANEIRQPFAWESAGDVLRYEIKIDKLNDQTQAWEEYYTHVTDEKETEDCLIFIQPTLPPGNYRSTIYVYNILGALEEDMTDVEQFTVRRAYQPEIKSLSYPLYMSKVIYLDDIDNNGIIEIEGKNLFVTDYTKQSLTSTDYSLKSIKKNIKPQQILDHDDEANKKIKFLFNMKELDVGKYHLIAKDLSGLHCENSSSNELIVKFKKWMDFDIEAGYTCPIVLHDDTINEYIGKTVFPLSGQAKISLIPFKHNWGYIGIGLRGNYSYFKSEMNGYEIDGNIMNAHGLLIYQIPFGRHRRVFWEFHGGMGLTYFHNIKFHFPHSIESEPLNTISLSYDGGTALMFYINKRLYIEAGGDYIFTPNKDMPMGEVLPYIGVGWQF